MLLTLVPDPLRWSRTFYRWQPKICHAPGSSRN
jgi:hypothetical protein